MPIANPFPSLMKSYRGMKKLGYDKSSHLQVHKYVTRRYLAATSLVLFVAVIGNTFLYNSISSQNHNAEIINIAGEQRMLLQRIAALTTIIHFKDKSLYLSDPVTLLLASTTQLKNRHLRLTEYLRALDASKHEITSLKAHYFNDPVNLNEQIVRFTELIRVFINTGASDKNIMRQINSAVTGHLLNDVDTAVALYQLDAEQGLTFTSTILKANTAIIVILLICQIIFIFRPLAHQLDKQANDLELKATIDGLTGLLNRWTYTTRFAKIIEQAHNRGDGVTVIALDVDWFKEINQSHGHMAGDKVLSEIGKRLRSLVNDTMEIARLGGDEFALIFAHNRGPDWPLQNAENIKKMVTQPVDYKGQPLLLSATAGIANFPGDATNINELLQAAIHALVLAKQQNRGTTQIFLPSQREGIERDKIILNSLEQKEDLDGLFIEFQPLIDLRTQQVTGCEALVRWNHPLLGRVGPDQFLKLAVSHGHGTFIGEIIRGLAMQGFKDIRLAESSIRSLSLNLMNVELKSISGPEELIAQINVFGLRPQDVEIEVTEDVVLDRFGGDLDSKLYNMRNAGFRLALDDFGTGFASLEHLVKLKVDVIKLDRTFIAQITKDVRSRQIINAIIKLAHDLSLKVVAEGIETNAQLEILKGLSCDIGQGYLLARPMTAANFLLWYKKNYELAITKA